MENEALKSYDFLDKVFLRPERADKGKRILKKLLIAMVIIIFLGELFSSGSIVYAFKKIIIFLPVTLFAFNGTGAGCKQIPTTINFYKDHMIKIYNGIDRQDKLGNRVEEVKINYDEITYIEYDRISLYMNIRAGTIVTINFSDNQVNHDYTGIPQDNKLFLNCEKREEFIRDVQSFTGVDVVHI